jgi:Mrp family chromosome partitioning ATPase/capsular polysaccharide biosynthesis protein
MESHDSRSPTELSWYLAVLWRRKWIIVPLVVVIPLVAYFVASGGTPLYSASSQVLLNRQSQSLSGVQDPTTFDPQRLVATQARLARVPTIATRVLAAAGLTDRGISDFLGHSSISADQSTDLLTFDVTDRNPHLAAKLATLYAEQYIAYRQQLDTLALVQASQEVQKQVDQLRNAGQIGSTLYANLVGQLEQLKTARTLLASDTLLVRTANGAAKVEPRPKRTALIGLALGLVLGLGVLLVVEALDTRIRSADEVAEAIGLSLLARLPPPLRKLRRRHLLATLDDPVSAQAEPFRILRTNLEFANIDRGCRSIMITSALTGEGKSTTAANLAVALARAGSRVMLVDLDVRRPSLHRFFDLAKRPGFTDVVLGRASLDDAVTPLTFGSPSSPDSFPGAVAAARGKRRPRPPVFGTLEVVGAGSVPANLGEFIATTELDDVLEQMESRVDLVIVDGPPMLTGGDALMLSAKIDGLVVVARLNSFRRDTIKELGRFLAGCPSEKLGFVVTDDGWNKDHRYHYDGAHSALGRGAERSARSPSPR